MAGAVEAAGAAGVVPHKMATLELSEISQYLCQFKSGQGTKCPFHDAFNVVLNVLSCLYTHGLYTHGNSLVGQKKLQPLRTLTFRINNCIKHQDPRLRKKLEKPKSTETKNKKRGKKQLKKNKQKYQR